MTCAGKEIFATFALADRVAALSNNRHAGYRLHAYKCSECGAFHVGSSIAPKRQGQKRRFTVLDEAA